MFHAAPCKALNTTPWMDVTLVKAVPGNESYPHGAVVKIGCSNGYALNLGSNRTARCE